MQTTRTRTHLSTYSQQNKYSSTSTEKHYRKEQRGSLFSRTRLPAQAFVSVHRHGVQMHSRLCETKRSSTRDARLHNRIARDGKTQCIMACRVEHYVVIHGRPILWYAPNGTAAGYSRSILCQASPPGLVPLAPPCSEVSMQSTPTQGLHPWTINQDICR